MYHSISDESESGVASYYQVNTRPAVFRQHLRLLAEAGYRTITLDELLTERLAGGQPARRTGPTDPGAAERKAACARPVVITFDDGFHDFYTEALPLLREHDFTATVFLPTAFIGASRRSFKGKACMTWAEVGEVRKAGMDLGSHTVNHPKLMELPWNEVRSELANSKAEIEQHLGEPLTSFAHPYAFPQAERAYVQGFRALLAETGYSCCVTTEVGRVRPGDDVFRLKRLPVNSLDDGALLEAKLQGSYDWLARPQAVLKELKKCLRAPGANRRRELPDSAVRLPAGPALKR